MSEHDEDDDRLCVCGHYESEHDPDDGDRCTAKDAGEPCDCEGFDLDTFEDIDVDDFYPDAFDEEH